MIFPTYLDRKYYFNDKEDGFFRKPKKKVVFPSLTHHTMLTDMMKGNVTNVPLVILIGKWVNLTFSGFISTKVPFLLSSLLSLCYSKESNYSHLMHPAEVMHPDISSMSLGFRAFTLILSWPVMSDPGADDRSCHGHACRHQQSFRDSGKLWSWQITSGH